MGHQITGKTKLVGLLGWPVSHSFSPAMQNAAFAELGIDWAYVPLPVRPEDVEGALQGLAALNFVGANVTVPHKQAVMRHLDELSEAAQITGAVNTIHIEDGRYCGYNTDARGFIKALEEAGHDPKGMRVAVLGAGGAARAVVYALTKAEVASIIVFNRTAERAAFLVSDLVEAFPDSHLGFKALTPDTLVALDDQLDLVINTTSVGMHPKIEASPWPDEVPVPNNTIFYDLVYNPLETTFLKQAKDAGQATVDGLGMLVHQGAFALQTWMGEETVPVKVMREAALRGLHGEL